MADSEDSYQAYVIAIKVAIEFCLNINATDFLFSEIIQVFKQHGLWLKFIQNLEPFIMSGHFKNELIPEKILAEFLDYYEKKDLSDKRNLERIVQQLELKQYSVDMIARLEIMC